MNDIYIKEPTSNNDRAVIKTKQGKLMIIQGHKTMGKPTSEEDQVRRGPNRMSC